MSLRSKAIRLATTNEALRPHLLPILAADTVKMEVGRNFGFQLGNNPAQTGRVSFGFSVNGTERAGTLYLNMNLSHPFEPDLVEHLAAYREASQDRDQPLARKLWGELPKFLRGSLLQDALKAAKIVGKRAGAVIVTLTSIGYPNR